MERHTACCSSGVSEILILLNKVFECVVSSHQTRGMDFFNLIPAPWGEGAVLSESQSVVPFQDETEVCRSKEFGSD